MAMLSRLLSDISYQSADNLVDGLTKLQEENYNHNKNIRTRSKIFPLLKLKLLNLCFIPSYIYSVLIDINYIFMLTHDKASVKLAIPKILYFPIFSVYHPDYKSLTGSGYVCPSDIFYGRPKRAENTFGEWKVIVNLPDSGPLLSRTGVDGSKYEKYTQTARSGHRDY